MRAIITAEGVRELLDYDAETGNLIWKSNRGGTARAGSVAGSDHIHGYRVVLVNNRSYKAHRLVWLHVNGSWPSGVIDHINGNPSDNRITNLRDVTHIVNCQNQRRASSNSRSGLLGVSFAPSKGRWRSVIYIRGKQKYLGVFDTPEEAHAAYLIAKLKYHEGANISPEESTEAMRRLHDTTVKQGEPA